MCATVSSAVLSSTPLIDPCINGIVETSQNHEKGLTPGWASARRSAPTAPNHKSITTLILRIGTVMR